MLPSSTSAHKPFSGLPSGLDVAPLSPAPGERIAIAERDEYHYYCYFLKSGQHIAIAPTQCASVFLPQVNNTLDEITVNGATVAAGGCALTELSALDITATRGSGFVLIAYSNRPSQAKAPSLTVHAAGEHYVVNKPWGHELWVNGEHAVFSFKEVFIKQGFQTSLQYHNYKVEAALLYDGVCDIVYKSNDAVSNDDVQPQDLSVAQLAEMGKICVTPGTLHRMRAATDMYHYEVSTPHLDDVVRVQDDNKRGHGRIKEEHMAL